MIDPRLPGADLVAAGLRDLTEGRTRTVEALLVTIGAPRLAALGLVVPPGVSEPEEELYAVLAREHGNGAHNQFNALIGRLVSFERASDCVA